MKQLLVVLCLFFILPSASFAQEEDTTATKKKYDLPYKVQVKYANKLLEVGNYFDAIAQYTQLLERKPENSQAQYGQAHAYRLSRDYKAAVGAYAAVVAADADSYDDLYYYYGLMLQQTESYAEAKAAFNTYVASEKANDDLKKHANIQIEACDFAIAGKNAESFYEITHLEAPVNKFKTELSPRIVDGDIMYFASLNDDSLLNGKFMNDSIPMSHIYKAKRTGSTWGNVEILGSPVNSYDTHSGGMALTDDGNRMYFSVCTGTGVNEISCDIFVTTKENGVWTEAKKVKGIAADEASSTQPAFGGTTDKGDVIYFSSNREGGEGGYDIYVTTVGEGGKGSNPKNLGSSVNTAWDEKTPYFWERKNKLFFSSNGHVGYGGFDNYATVINNEGKWETPVNLGYPVNSGADDMGYAIGKDDRKEYFLVSNRPGIFGEMSETCCDDIFRAYNTFEPTLAVAGNITLREDSVVMGALRGVRIELYDITDGVPRLVASDSLTTSTFNFPIQADKKYSLQFQKWPDHFPVKQEFNTFLAEKSDTIYSEILMDRIIINKSYVLSKIYYAYRSAKLTNESKTALDTLYMLMQENPDIIVELSAHTDSIGSDGYNLQLSEDRAKSCVDYLLSLGVEAERLKPVGYGETKPVEPNSINGKDNPEGRAKNRRTEYKILGNLERRGDEVILEE